MIDRERLDREVIAMLDKTRHIPTDANSNDLDVVIMDQDSYGIMDQWMIMACHNLNQDLGPF